MCFGEIWKIETNEKKRKIPRSPWPSIVSIWYTSFRVSDFFYITLKTREWDHTVDTDLQPAVYRLIIVGAYAHAVTHFSPAWRNVNQSVGGGDFRELCGRQRPRARGGGVFAGSAFRPSWPCPWLTPLGCVLCPDVGLRDSAHPCPSP